MTDSPRAAVTSRRPRRLFIGSAIGCLIIAALSIWLAFGAAQHELARLASERLNADPGNAALERLVTSRLDASGLFRLGARHAQLRGRLATIRADAAPPDQQLDLYRQALGWYSTAAARQPLWPGHQADIVTSKLMLNENDADFHQALLRLFQLGPNDTRLFVEMFPRLRLNSWWLSETERTALLAWTSRAAWREPAFVVAMAARYDYLDPLCTHVSDNLLASEHCERALSRQQGLQP